jgi:hypothetical protein
MCLPGWYQSQTFEISYERIANMINHLDHVCLRDMFVFPVSQS